MVAVPFEPSRQFFFMPPLGLVGVVAIEECDSHNVIRDCLDRVQIAKNKTAAATMTAQHQLGWLIVEALAHSGDDCRDGLVTMLLSPCRPSLLRRFQINDHDSALRQKLAHEPRLCADVLNVVMPIVARTTLSSHGLS